MDVDGTASTGCGGNGRPNSGAILQNSLLLKYDPTGVSFMPWLRNLPTSDPSDVSALVQIKVHSIKRFLVSCV